MPFTSINTQDSSLQRVQDNVAKAVRDIEAKPFQGGNLLTGIVLTLGVANLIEHKLKRTPQVWVVADINANAGVWRTAWDENYLTLWCDTSCTVNLWVA